MTDPLRDVPAVAFGAVFALAAWFVLERKLGLGSWAHSVSDAQLVAWAQEALWVLLR